MITGRALMSFWFRRRDSQGRVYYFSVSVPLLVVVAVVGVLIAILLPVIQSLR